MFRKQIEALRPRIVLFRMDTRAAAIAVQKAEADLVGMPSSAEFIDVIGSDQRSYDH
jgi:hypothetical protein